MMIKLYLVTLRGLHSSTQVNLNQTYVVASNSDEAYLLVEEYCRIKDVGFEHDRSLDNVKLIAEMGDYPDCRTMLMIHGNVFGMFDGGSETSL